MSLIVPPTIDAAPAAPDRSDRITFGAKALAFMIWMKNVVAQFAALALNVYNNALDAYASAQSAAAAALTATAASGVSVWASGAYAPGAAARSPANGAVYTRLAPGGASPTDPSLDPANWRLMSLDLVDVPVVGTSYSAVHGVRAHIQNPAASVITAPINPTDGMYFGIKVENAIDLNTVHWNGALFEDSTDADHILDNAYGSYLFKFFNTKWRVQ